MRGTILECYSGLEGRKCLRLDGPGTMANTVPPDYMVKRLKAALDGGRVATVTAPAFVMLEECSVEYSVPGGWDVLLGAWQASAQKRLDTMRERHRMEDEIIGEQMVLALK
jgi:hypothetical protein